jgi:hypothetical protein
MMAIQITAIQVMAHAQVRPLPLIRGGLGWGLSPVSLTANLFVLFWSLKPKNRVKRLAARLFFDFNVKFALGFCFC